MAETCLFSPYRMMQPAARLPILEAIRTGHHQTLWVEMEVAMHWGIPHGIARGVGVRHRGERDRMGTMTRLSANGSPAGVVPSSNAPTMAESVATLVCRLMAASDPFFTPTRAVAFRDPWWFHD